jgi:hypothetical protein
VRCSNRALCSVTEVIILQAEAQAEAHGLRNCDRFKAGQEGRQ